MSLTRKKQACSRRQQLAPVPPPGELDETYDLKTGDIVDDFK